MKEQQGQNYILLYINVWTCDVAVILMGCFIKKKL